MGMRQLSRQVSGSSTPTTTAASQSPGCPAVPASDIRAFGWFPAILETINPGAQDLSQFHFTSDK
jgi:hypothetical protein